MAPPRRAWSARCVTPETPVRARICQSVRLEEKRMSRVFGSLFLLVCTLAVPGAAWAQAALAGAVRDTSGALLPGVTVEAASPALIEKVRSATTDGAGRYRIEDLRPGTYTVTFTLQGFSTVRREM